MKLANGHLKATAIVKELKHMEDAVIKAEVGKENTNGTFNPDQRPLSLSHIRNYTCMLMIGHGDIQQGNVNSLMYLHRGPTLNPFLALAPQGCEGARSIRRVIKFLQVYMLSKLQVLILLCLFCSPDFSVIYLRMYCSLYLHYLNIRQ